MPDSVALVSTKQCKMVLETLMEVQVREDEWLTPHSDGMEQIIELAERLATSHGGALDDDDILAVVEATGAPEEYIRLALKLRSEKVKTGALARARSSYLTLETSQKKYVVSGILAFGATLFQSLERVAHSWSTAMRNSSYGLFGMVEWLVVAGAIYNVSQTRDRKTALVGGAIFGGAFFMFRSFMAMVFGLQMQVDPSLILVFIGGGAGIGVLSQGLVARLRSKLGLKDPARERHDMLKELIDLQAKLRTGEQQITFMSIDMVGSTRMKETADPLAVEFTFNEYHLYVERTIQRFNGRVHSTAGDGITCVFEDPNAAFKASKAIQSGLFEFNSFRNRLASPVKLRIGLHTGLVVPPEQGDMTSVNFAHVIDISAHLQKTATPGGVAVSDATIAHIPGGKATIGTDRVEASGVSGSLWMSKQVQLSVGLPDVPALPSQA